MRKRLLFDGLGLLFAWCVFCIPVTGKDHPEYAVANISPALCKDANAIIRNYEQWFEVRDERSAVEKVKMVVTVFKKEKRDYGYLCLDYDKYKSIESFEGSMYDAQGKLIRELESSDMKDECSFDGYSLFQDEHERIAELYHEQYPYTIELTYEIHFDGYLNWPAWFSRNTLDPVEHSKLEVVLPKDSTLRYWCNRDSVVPKTFVDGNRKHYLWETFALPLLKKDEAGDDIEDVATVVRLAPTVFIFHEYPGSMTSWKNIGQWEFDLYKGRDVLPASAVHDVHILTDTLHDVREKIHALYTYMQNRTRYVSVQLGIGGWQPFDAAYVHEHGYGDCKALSNYMIALLKEAGVQAYPYTILYGTHSYPFINEFPSENFNHIMVCVPLKDTIWLECTDQSIPFGHISSNTENRGVLLLTPDGGIVTHTPQSTPRQNEQRQSGEVRLTYFGSADASTRSIRTGNQQDYIRHALYTATPEERERWISYTLGVPNAPVTRYDIHGLESHELTVGVDMNIVLPRFASVTGDRIFFQPNLLERKTYVPPVITQRLAPIRFSYPYLDTDSIRYQLPVGYQVESLPTEVNIQTSFGGFHSKSVVQGDTALIYTRAFEIHEYIIPAQNYHEYQKFYSDVVKADRAQVVLLHKQN